MVGSLIHSLLLRLLSIVGTEACLIVARLIMIAPCPQNVQVGYIGDIPRLVAPTAAIGLAVVCYAASVLLRRFL